MKIALVYDWLDTNGGVERMIKYIHEIYPEAPIYTSFYTEAANSVYTVEQIRPSFMQRLPRFLTRSRLLSFPLFPYAFEQFEFDEFDVVLSISSSFAKGVITKPGTTHLSIVLTPTRYLWVLPQQYRKKGLLGYIQAVASSAMRRWDFVAAQRPDKLLSISNLVQKRVKAFYNRDSEVLYPGFDFGYWEEKEKQAKPVAILPKEYFLVVSRLEPYKKVEETIKAFKNYHLPLVIVGGGSQLSELKKIADNNCIFTGSISDEDLAYTYANARGFIAVQEEDFGYIALEAAFFGCPIIAYTRSGIAEILTDITKKILVTSNDVTAIRDGLERCLSLPYNGRVEDQLKNRTVLQRFSKEVFQKQLQNQVESLIVRSKK